MKQKDSPTCGFDVQDCTNSKSQYTDHGDRNPIEVGKLREELVKTKLDYIKQFEACKSMEAIMKRLEPQSTCEKSQSNKKEEVYTPTMQRVTSCERNDILELNSLGGEIEQKDAAIDFLEEEMSKLDCKAEILGAHFMQVDERHSQLIKNYNKLAKHREKMENKTGGLSVVHSENNVDGQVGKLLTQLQCNVASSENYLTQKINIDKETTELENLINKYKAEREVLNQQGNYVQNTLHK